MLTLHDAASLIAAASSLDGLAPLAAAIGCPGDPAPLDDDTLRSLGVARDVDAARIATGPGALRALLVSIPDRVPLRERLPRLAAHLSSRAPHVLWIVLGAQPSSGSVVVAAWNGARRPPRVAALIAQRQHLVDSDAETIRALSAATAARDVLTHARWVEVLGREALTVRFYRALEAAIEGMAHSSRAAAALHVRRELALLDASRLLFLCFLEAKGWLDHDPAFLTRAFERCLERRGGFRNAVLRPLFFGTLNTPPAKRAAAARRFGHVPFLNGGLFSRTPLERRCRDLVISDDAYGALLFDVFGQFRFTAHEESASWNEAAVDPEMLGKSFESLMASGERRRSGAFFTPFSLVERVTQCALDAVSPTTVVALRELTVVDPACGSGAFLVHMLERLAERARALGDERPIASLRREVLTRSIFGVDINPAAVWLCQLRLWLSVVIESDETDPARVVPLPNLDRNIRVGDSLAGHDFSPAGAGPLVSSIARLRERYARSTGSRKDSLARALDRAERARALSAIDQELATVAERRRDLVVARRGRDLFGARYRASPLERAAAVRLRRLAAALRAQRTAIARGSALPFSFGTHFADIAARGGFSLVLTNPPWVRLHRIPTERRESFRRDFFVAHRAAWLAGAEAAGAASGFAGQIDLASLFIERCAALTSCGGALALLVPAKLWRSLAGGGVRQLVASEMELLRIEDYAAAPAVFDAAVYPSLVVARRRRNEGSARDVSIVAHAGHDVFRWAVPASDLPFDDSPGAPWLLLPPDVRHAFHLLRRAAAPLALSELGRPLLGVKCGCNDAFLVELVDVRGDVADVVTSAGNAITVERSLVRPLLRGESLRPWAVPDSYDSILWTHDDSGSALSRLPPLTAAWLSRWRHSLANRSDARHRGRWWSLFRIESARSDRPRVVWGDVGKELRASVLPAGDARVPLNTCYVVRCRDDCDAHALAALLNGPIARAWLNALAEPARGGYHRYLGWTLALLPLPARWDAARESLADLGRRAAAGGARVNDLDLLDAAAAAYGVTQESIAPLVAWSGG